MRSGLYPIRQGIRSDVKWLGLEAPRDYRAHFDIALLFRVPTFHSTATHTVAVAMAAAGATGGGAAGAAGGGAGESASDLATDLKKSLSLSDHADDVSGSTTTSATATASASATTTSQLCCGGGSGGDSGVDDEILQHDPSNTAYGYEGVRYYSRERHTPWAVLHAPLSTHTHMYTKQCMHV